MLRPTTAAALRAALDCPSSRSARLPPHFLLHLHGDHAHMLGSETLAAGLRFPKPLAVT
jgi:hypothetical protein